MAARDNAVRKSRTRGGRTPARPEPQLPADGAAPQLDRLIHERMRLAIVSTLAVHESLSFNDLKRLLKTTDGNLSVHARKLEEAQYLVCTKSFAGRTLGASGSGRASRRSVL